MTIRPSVWTTDVTTVPLKPDELVFTVGSGMTFPVTAACRGRIFPTGQPAGSAKRSSHQRRPDQAPAASSS